MPVGLILQPTYRVRGGKPVVQLYGRLENGDAFLVEDLRFRPYFFLAREQWRLLRSETDVQIDDTELCDLEGRPVLRVTVSVPGAIPPLRERLEARGARPLEADVRFPYRFLVDRGLRGGVEIRGEAKTLRPGFVRFRDPELLPARARPALRTLSIDLETSPDAGEVYSIAMLGDFGGVDEVHLVADRPVAGAVAHADERALLAAAEARVRELDPDILTGWNVVDFDLRVWVRRAGACGLRGHLGRMEDGVLFQQDPGFTRQSRAVMSGRMVIDAIALVRDAVRLEDYRLETAAQTLLGRGKRIRDVPDAAREIQRLFREEPEALVAYNREDARLVLDILEREDLLALTLERSLLTGMQLDRVGASIASFDLLYLPELRRRGHVAPSVDRERKSELVKGGALLDPQPGIFRNVAVFDFKSLYPSLIRTFQLDPLAHARADADASSALEAPNGARFAREGSILPEIIERFMTSREEAKRRGDRHADQAIKIMMNALFGVLGAASCRFFNPAIANAITGFGQQTLHWTRDAFEALGVRVVYGDTDSLFVLLEESGSPDSARARAEALRDAVQAAIGARIRDTYATEPRLELELEYVYDRFYLPRVRGGGGGSKKRYAGWRDGRLEVIGLESVRRDWPAVSARLQRGLLERLFTDRPLEPFVREIVTRVRQGELDEELVYVKRIRKGSLDRYTASTPPHIQAARKAGGMLGPVVRYVITSTDGPEPAIPGRPLPGPIDRRHYVERVLRPVADAILTDAGLSFDEAMGAPRQLTLL